MRKSSRRVQTKPGTMASRGRRWAGSEDERSGDVEQDVDQDPSSEDDEGEGDVAARHDEHGAGCRTVRDRR